MLDSDTARENYRLFYELVRPVELSANSQLLMHAPAKEEVLS